jgi:hypothetical protein
MDCECYPMHQERLFAYRATGGSKPWPNEWNISLLMRAKRQIEASGTRAFETNDPVTSVHEHQEFQEY